MAKIEKDKEDNSRSEEQLLESRMINSFTFHVDFSIDIPLEKAKDFLADLTSLKIKWSG